MTKELSAATQISCCLFLVLGSGFNIAESALATINVARGKPTWQSSTWTDDYADFRTCAPCGGSNRPIECPFNSRRGRKYPSSLAVDGNRNSDLGRISCTHTEADDLAWWYVDLGKVYKITSVSLTNRNTLDQRLRDFVILGTMKKLLIPNDYPGLGGVLRRSPSPPSVQYCHEFQAQQVPVAATQGFLCRAGFKARYVYIMKADREDRHRYLTLCEVEVFAEVFNVARGKETRMSSVHGNGRSEQAVDGNKQTRHSNRPCAHTQDDDPAWWYVNLEKVYRILSVVITNRFDGCPVDGGCGFRLRRFVIFGSRNLKDIGTGNSQYPGTQHLRDSPSFPDVFYCRRHQEESEENGVTQPFRCDPPIEAKYVYVVKSDRTNNQQYLTLCEVEVEAECLSGQYDIQNGCNATCSYCKNGDCDDEGVCRAGFQSQSREMCSSVTMEPIPTTPCPPPGEMNPCPQTDEVTACPEVVCPSCGQCSNNTDRLLDCPMEPTACPVCGNATICPGSRALKDGSQESANSDKSGGTPNSGTSVGSSKSDTSGESSNSDTSVDETSGLSQKSKAKDNSGIPFWGFTLIAWLVSAVAFVIGVLVTLFTYKETTEPEKEFEAATIASGGVTNPNRRETAATKDRDVSIYTATTEGTDATQYTITTEDTDATVIL